MTSKPRLSMLWESVDPAAALTARFGFADPNAAVAWVGAALWDHWAIRVDRCDRLVISDRNALAWITSEGTPLIAKWSVAAERFRRLADVAPLQVWLAGRGVPVAAPIPATDGRVRAEVNGRSLGVSPVIEGELLDVEDPAQVTQAGRLFATLHAALAAYPASVDGGHPNGPDQLVHHDFRSANLLHDGSKITAVLDFDEVTYASRLGDLARSAVLLGTRYHDWAPTGPEVRKRFIAAYRDQIPLTDAEQHELQATIERVLDHFGWT